MASPICEERSDLHSPKRQKIEANICDDDYDSDSPKRQKIEANICNSPERQTIDGYDSDEEIRRFNDEWDKSDGFEFDFSKLTNSFSFRPVDLDGDYWVEELETDTETDRDFIAFLAKEALTKRNLATGESLEFGKILRANFHPAAGLTFYISFEVHDPSESDGNRTKPFRAIVGYLRSDNFTIYSCDPRPSS